MEATEVVRESLTLFEVGKGFVIAFLLSQFQTPPASQLGRRKLRKPVWSSEVISIGGYFALYLLSHSWLALVDHYVPDPYLDEVFHVPQAQAYCNGQYFDWDDKITTPPGLYVLSVIWHKFWMMDECSTFTLRSLNLLAILQTALLASVCRNMVEAGVAAREGRKDYQSFSFYTYHTALNIGLFPVLFFFSALYYTDVFSTLLVLVSYQNHLARVSRESNTLANDMWTVLLGIGALSMRQTNVFWIVVYMSGLEAVHALRSLNPPAATEKPRPGSVFETAHFYVRRYSLGEIHDPPLALSWPDDWLLCAASLAIAAICNPVKMSRQVWPHIAVLASFTGFAVWNGGVVLGDKSNHVVTMHFAQMLYIWPFFAFFSAPLLAPSLLSLVSSALRRVYPSATAPVTAGTPELARATKKTTNDAPQTQTAETARALNSGKHVTAKRSYYALCAVGTVLLSLAAVRFNTVIHPFTLADNRHYMFYIFRYTILRPSLARYYLVGAYLASGWLVWNRLAGSPPPSRASADGDSPAEKQSMPQLTGTSTATEKVGTEVKEKKEEEEQEEGPSDAAENEKQSPPPAALSAFVFGGLDEPTSVSSFSPPTSTALLWLLATTLSLVTAPLVEPRYFILPWVFWRLLVPACAAPSPAAWWPSDPTGLRWLFGLGRRMDLTLVLETAWFLAINLGTMYMFLFKPFYWTSENGELLDGGRVQRFMW